MAASRRVFGLSQFTTDQVHVGQMALYLLKGGSERPCLVLHEVEGNEGWLAFHESLAEQSTVYAPSHPGYGLTDCPSWISSVAHQAVFYNWFLQAAGFDFSRPDHRTELSPTPRKRPSYR